MKIVYFNIQQIELERIEKRRGWLSDLFIPNLYSEIMNFVAKKIKLKFFYKL